MARQTNRYRNLLLQLCNNQPVQSIAGNDCAAFEKWIDAPGSDENVDVVVHVIIGQARFGVHVCLFGQFSLRNFATVENTDTGSVVRLINPITFNEEVVVDGCRR